MKLEHIEAVTWKSIWEDWRKNEEESWRVHYTERGFDSWDAWRSRYFEVFDPRKFSWSQYRLEDPLADVPEMFVGPFRGWVPYYEDREQSRFKNIIQHPKFLGDEKDVKVREIVRSFPEKTQLIALRCKDKVMIVEGTHRSCAIALAAQEGLGLESEILIALTDVDEQTFENVVNHVVVVPYAHELKEQV